MCTALVCLQQISGALEEPMVRWSGHLPNGVVTSVWHHQAGMYSSLYSVSEGRGGGQNCLSAYEQKTTLKRHPEPCRHRNDGNNVADVVGIWCFWGNLLTNKNTNTPTAMMSLKQQWTQKKIMKMVVGGRSPRTMMMTVLTIKIMYS